MWKNLVMSVINFVRNFKDTSTLKYFKKKVEMGDIMQHIFKKLEEDKAIKKVIYMLMAMGYAYYEVRQIREIFKKDSFREIAKPAIKRISYEMKVNMITEQEIAEFIYREEPYLGYLYFEAGYDISILIIMFIYRNGLNLLDIFLIPL